MDTTKDSATENDLLGKMRRENTFISPNASISGKTRSNINWNTEYETENQPPITTTKDMTTNVQETREIPMNTDETPFIATKLRQTTRTAQLLIPATQ